MDLLCGQKWVCSRATLYPSPQLPCVNNSKSFTRSRKSCVDWPVPAHHMRVSEHIQRACTQYLMHAPHTSTTDYVVLSSCRFIRLHLWCGIRSLRNTVLGKETQWICALRSSEEACHWSPLRLLVSPSLCLLLSITHSPTSLRHSTDIHYHHLFSSF